MNCPNCGAVIPDDKLICEKCGAELQIITDLDFDIETEMQETLNNIVENEFSDDDTDYSFYDDGMEYDEEPNFLSQLLSGRAGGKIFYALLVIVFVGVIIAAVYLGKKISSQNTFDYKIQMAEECVSNNRILDAIDYYEDAYKLEPSTDILFKIAEFYNELGRENDSIYTLMTIAEDESNSDRDIETAYKKVISLYENAKAYDKLAELIDNCTNRTISMAYADYGVCLPEFNLEGGTYEETIAVKLSGSLNGKIYYSMDASTPSEASEEFTIPIFLEYGNYTISAIFVNNYGVKSEVVKQKYLIDVDFTFEPTILTDSGTFEHGTMIEAEVPVMYTLYYTTDGSTPDKTSTKYTGPIPVPLGKTTYKFIEYAMDGTQSTIVERTYELKFDSAVNAETAIPYLMFKLYEKGYLSDTTGHKEGKSGVYSYVFTTAYFIEQKQDDYFFIVEYYTDTHGNTTKTGNIYAMHSVDANDLYMVSSYGNGTYEFSSFY